MSFGFFTGAVEKVTAAFTCSRQETAPVAVPASASSQDRLGAHYSQHLAGALGGPRPPGPAERSPATYPTATSLHTAPSTTLFSERVTAEVRDAMLAQLDVAAGNVKRIPQTYTARPSAFDSTAADGRHSAGALYSSAPAPLSKR